MPSATATATPARKRKRTRAAATAPALPAGTIAQLPRDLAVEWVRISSIKRYANNPRENDLAVPDVAASLVAFGWEQPLVVDRAGVIVVGDTRYLAALQLQQSHVPIYRATHLTPEQADAYRLADNKSGERAKWDFGRLKAEFDQLAARGADLATTGFRPYEMEPIVASTWGPVAAEAGALKKPAEEGDDPSVVRFTVAQLEVVLRAAEKMRKALRKPQLELAEALAKVCTIYAALPK